jgi:hypothetical protein
MKKETEWYYFYNPLMGVVWYSDYDEAVASRRAYELAGHKVGEVLCKS